MEESLKEGKRILIIEDEAFFRDMLKTELTKEGYEVEGAVDGAEGMEKMKEHKPDLIVLDIVMPRKDGFSVLEEMKKEESLKSIPIIVLSNSGDVVEISQVKTMGVKDVLVKTVFGPKELLERIRSVLGVTLGTSAPQDSREPENTEEQGEPAQAPAPASGADGEAVGQNKAGQASVLLVEDDPFLWSLVRAKLVKEGFDVKVAKDGQEGLDMVKSEQKPDVILLDLVLPDVDGFTVLERIKKDDSVSKIPVIILSNLGQQEDITKGIDLGAKDYLIKAHHTPQEIVDKVKQVLAKK